MKIARDIASLAAIRDGCVGLVPTMGAFHEGHLELMRAARQENDTVVVSLFVNPTQFGPSEDFERYPRNEERDFALAEAAGVDAVFAPSVEEMYPSAQTYVHVTKLSQRWEGEHRPGHFDGVATVVSKFFNIVRPQKAYFGLKDLQQCAVIRTMAADLNFPVQLRFIETVREPDGLALSSRNAMLDPADRQKAPLLYRAMTKAASDIKGASEALSVQAILEEQKSILRDAGFALDYLALVDENNLEPLDAYRPNARLIVAAKLGRTRLIDNRPIND